MSAAGLRADATSRYRPFHAALEELLADSDAQAGFDEVGELSDLKGGLSGKQVVKGEVLQNGEPFGRVVLKLKSEKEYRASGILAELGVAPRVLFPKAWPEATERAVVIDEFVANDPVLRFNALEECAKLIATIHAAECAALEDDPPPADVFAAENVTALLFSGEDCEDGLQSTILPLEEWYATNYDKAGVSDLVPACLALWHKLPGILRGIVQTLHPKVQVAVCKRALLHGDFWHGNIHASQDADGKTVVKAIDFEDCGVKSFPLIDLGNFIDSRGHEAGQLQNQTGREFEATVSESRTFVRSYLVASGQQDIAEEHFDDYYLVAEVFAIAKAITSASYGVRVCPEPVIRRMHAVVLDVFAPLLDRLVHDPAARSEVATQGAMSFSRAGP